MSADLVAFLSACVDEDERIAREATDGDSGRWFMDDRWNVHRGENEAEYDEDGGEEHRLVVYGNVKPQMEHIARQNPAATLRRVESDRLIVAEHKIVYDGIDEGEVYATRDSGDRQRFGCRVCHMDDRAIYDEGYCLTLKALGLRYDDRPDYREEWRS